jgi:hypothetical protein
VLFHGQLGKSAAATENDVVAVGELLGRIKVPARENHDVVPLGERLLRTFPTRWSGTKMFDERSDAQRPRQLMRQESDRPVKV